MIQKRLVILNVLKALWVVIKKKKVSLTKKGNHLAIIKNNHP